MWTNCGGTKLHEEQLIAESSALSPIQHAVRDKDNVLEHSTLFNWRFDSFFFVLSLAPFRTLHSSQVITLTKDDTVMIMLRGFSAADVEWMKDGESIDSLAAGRYEIQADGSLLIRDVRRSDAGSYSIYISSLNLPAGTPAEIISVTVQGILQINSMVHCSKRSQFHPNQALSPYSLSSLWNSQPIFSCDFFFFLVGIVL